MVPWVVQIDKLGEAQAVAPAAADYGPIDPQIAWHLARFIENVRAIPADAVIVRQNLLRAYEFTTDRGAVALNDYARANDPFTKVGKVQVAVDVPPSSALRPEASASPDPSAATKTGNSHPPSAAPTSSLSWSNSRARPTSCVSIRSGSLSTPSTDRRSFRNEGNYSNIDEHDPLGQGRYAGNGVAGGNHVFRLRQKVYPARDRL